MPNPEADASFAGSGGVGGSGASGGAGGSAADSGLHAMDASNDPLDAMLLDASDAADQAHDADVDPARYVYVGTGFWSGDEPGRIAVYRLEDDGQLSFIERIEAGDIAAYMAVDLERRELYVTDEGAGALRRYDVDPATGRLTLDDTLDIPGAPVYVALDSRGRTVLTASYDEGLARAFAVDDEGFIAPASDTETTGTQAHSIVISADDGFAYVCNKGSNTISQLRFDADAHTLTPLAPATAPHAGAPRHAAFAADGRFLYVVSESDDSVRVHTRGAQGTLSLLQSLPRLPSGQSGTGAHVLLSPHGHLYASNREPSNTLVVYDVDAASGMLSFVEHEPTEGDGPRNFAIDPEGHYLIAGNLASQNVAVFAIDAGTGALTYVRTLDVEGSPFFVGIYAFE